MPLQLAGYSVWITSGQRQQELTQFKVERDDTDSISCYIPSVVDEDFCIRWKDRSRNRNAIVACYMDGRPVGGVPTYPGFNGENKGVFTAMNKLKPFKFSALVLTDDDDIADPDGASPDLGCIQIEIHRVLPGLINDDGMARHGEIMDVGPVHERSKKLGTHCVSLGQEQRADGKARKFVAPTYSGNGPCAVFKFFYRSKEFLLARNIIPPAGTVPDNGSNLVDRAHPARRKTRQQTRIESQLTRGHATNDHNAIKRESSVKAETLDPPSVFPKTEPAEQSVPIAGPSRVVPKSES